MLRRSLSHAAVAALLLAVAAGPASAEEKKLKITGDATSVTVPGPDGDIVIERVKTPCALIGGVLQPMVPVEGVTPVGEIEVLDGLRDPDTLVIDMRELDWYIEATIPNAINIPYTEIASRMDELGCEKGGDAWDCADAKKIIAFCNGPVCPQSPTAIRALDREGFPMDKVMYYRGGMQSWKVLGFTTVEGEM